jgi:hypothetical protein
MKPIVRGHFLDDEGDFPLSPHDRRIFMGYCQSHGIPEKTTQFPFEKHGFSDAIPLSWDDADVNPVWGLLDQLAETERAFCSQEWTDNTRGEEMPGLCHDDVTLVTVASTRG